jgi:hypothetical protein
MIGNPYQCIVDWNALLQMHLLLIYQPHIQLQIQMLELLVVMQHTIK